MVGKILDDCLLLYQGGIIAFLPFERIFQSFSLVFGFIYTTKSSMHLLLFKDSSHLRGTGITAF